jgi:uncharacterized protein YndB with AHSA1/START domain
MTAGDELGAMDGYLLLADISGYTTFLTGNELEHSHAIVTELTKLIRSRLIPPMRFVKLEGDAVFCFAGADAFPDGEQLVELVESCYFDFSSRLLDMTRSTTCRCDACRAIGGLDLKFVVHYGTFIVDRDDDDGRIDLAGPDVILAHRLLKNTIVESGGPEAYAFFSDSCLAGSPNWLSLPAHSESYDSFTEVTGRVQDLAAVSDRRRESQRIRVTPEDAGIDVSYIIEAPPSVVWQYWVQPEKRAKWAWAATETSVVFTPNGDGRRGTGGSSHCAHSVGGDSLREYLDWRPYEYFTCRFTPLPAEVVTTVPWIETQGLTSVGENQTECRMTLRCTDESAEALAGFEFIAALFNDPAFIAQLAGALQAAIDEDAVLFGLNEPRD